MPSSSTTLFDRLVAPAHPHPAPRLRLADGTFLLDQASPGADAVEVFLCAGLTAPNTNAWTRDDLWECLMTGGTPGDVIYRDVPVSAVRELILQHGGEHPDQGATPTRPSLNRHEQWAPDLAATITDLRGRLADGSASTTSRRSSAASRTRAVPSSPAYGSTSTRTVSAAPRSSSTRTPTADSSN
ncbi:hypothetical protein [Streptomyces sp. CNQ431]|uniref:hypothetical protein n=1 Tax=Streptomyces sp. CNQ431 TaxID=1571532 RepID=UPI00053E3934|nr:hypothetical protein [Streptomyces sp. CNQ431]